MTGRLIQRVGDFRPGKTGYLMKNDYQEPLNRPDKEGEFIPDFMFRPDGTRQCIGVTKQEVQILS